MLDPHHLILRPVVTEKTSRQEEQRAYTFIVRPDATKIDIRRAVEHLFDVTVTGVRTMRYPAKPRRAFMARLARTYARGRRASFKKAVVTVAPGDQIDLYEAG